MRETSDPLKNAVLASDFQLVKHLLAQGASADLIDEHGMTPLLWAVWRGDVECASALLEAGADPNLHKHPAGSPLWHAEDDFGLETIAALLRQYGAVK